MKKITNQLQITPDEILTEESVSFDEQEAEILEELKDCSPLQRKTALRLLSVYLQSLK